MEAQMLLILASRRLLQNSMSVQTKSIKQIYEKVKNTSIYISFDIPDTLLILPGAPGLFVIGTIFIIGLGMW